MLHTQISIKPPAGLHGLTADDVALQFEYGNARHLLLTDASASWGLGSEAAALSLQKLKTEVSGRASSLPTAAELLEQLSLAAAEELSAEHEDADTLFSATLLSIQERTLSCAWAGDILTAVFSPRNGVRWINYPNHSTASEASSWPVRAKPASWYPGLLGCTRAQRASALLELGPKVTLEQDELVLMLSSALWTHLGEGVLERLLNAHPRTQVHDEIVAHAEAKGAKGFRCFASAWLD